MAKINETLKQLRLERGLTQEDVAERVGLTRQAVSSYESGRTQPGLDILERLAQVYEVELADVIYGRNQGIRLYNGLKITAIVMTCVFLAAQLACSVLMWVANRFFSLDPGTLTEAEKVTLVVRGRLMTVWTALDGMYLGLLPLCCVALLVLTFCLRRPLAAKVKVLSILGYAVASMVVVLPWALTDPVFPPINYLTTPGLCLAQLVFFLLVSLVIDLFRTRKLGRDGNAGEPDDREEEVSIPICKRWWFWILTAAVVAAVVLISVAVLPKSDTVEIPPVENPAFTLNGEDYPKSPVLQDFLDRGWRRGKWVEKTGIYDEQGRVTELVTDGYRMTSGEHYLTVNLEAEELRNGTKRNDCHLDSLSFFGDNIAEFTVNGAELVGMDREKRVETLGEAAKSEVSEFGTVTYRYSMPEAGIAELLLIYPPEEGPALQVIVEFEQ